ncbi:MAG: UPF0175 family protein [Bacteroidota bacterium]
MSVQIEIPVDLPLSEFELKMRFAAKLFDDGLISTGQGAKMVGISRRAFIELLGKYKVSIFQYGIEEIIEDAARA